MAARLIPVHHGIGEIGRSKRGHEVLNGMRDLSIGLIRRMHRQFDIPADVLIRAPERKDIESA